MNSDMVEQIQIKIAYLERANADLSDVVFRQQRELEALGAKMLVLLERLESNRSDERQTTFADERPPHY